MVTTRHTPLVVSGRGRALVEADGVAVGVRKIAHQLVSLIGVFSMATVPPPSLALASVSSIESTST